MRYRPFGATGTAVSNLTLKVGIEAVSRGPTEASELIYAALEAGINSYCLESADPVLAEVVGNALSNVDRKLLNVTVIVGRSVGRKASKNRIADEAFSGPGMTHAIDRALHISGLGWLDVVLLDQPGEEELPQTSLEALKVMRSTERVRYLGICGDGEVMDTYVSTGAFDVLSSPYHVDSDWKIRSRLRAAREQDMAIFAFDYFPESLNSLKKAAGAHIKKKGFFGFGSGKDKIDKNNPLAGAGTYAFLHQTQNWTAESICLSHVLNDPGVSSVLISANDIERLNALSIIPDRDMPPGLSAQIEMARVRAATSNAA